MLDSAKAGLREAAKHNEGAELIRDEILRRFEEKDKKLAETEAKLRKAVGASVLRGQTASKFFATSARKTPLNHNFISGD